MQEPSKSGESTTGGSRTGESRLTPDAIAELLIPYVEHASALGLPDDLFSNLSAYLEILLRWNARTNLTAVRTPEEIVKRHFGESLFAAQQVLAAGKPGTLADVGSGAGFPGIPLKLLVPQLQVTLIEAHQKKATFLREVIRALRLDEIVVQEIRAEQVSQTFDVVTVRAVERFAQILPVAGGLLNASGRLVLLIGEEQVDPAKAILPALRWEEPVLMPESDGRVVLVGMTAEVLML